MTRPMWFLDVDGVINALHHQPGYRRTDVRAMAAWGSEHEFKIRYSKPLVDRIVELGSSLLDITWLTTWGHQAVSALSPALGFPEYPVARNINEMGDPVVGPEWWKYQAVMRAQDKLQRVVWTDDDIPDDMITAVNGAGGLAIRPHPNVGLKMADLDRITEYAERYATRQADTP